MDDFSINLRLDTPLLQSGAVSGNPDPSGQLRGPSVRGLFHTWARALLGPLLGDDPAKTRRDEHLLLGAPGGAPDGKGATFRLQIEPPGVLALGWQEYLNCPHDSGKGKRKGHKDGQTTKVWVQPRHGSLPDDLNLPTMLWVVAWTGFCLGAIGNRSRRGYGSLTIQNVSPGLSLGGLVREDGSLPVFSTPPADRDFLGRELKRGLILARQATASWLKLSTPPPVASIRSPTGYPFFELESLQQVFVGQPNSAINDGGNALMSVLMQACKSVAGKLGSAIPSRLASPLWVRIYQLASGQYCPVATFSPFTTASPALMDQINAANQILKNIGCEDLAGSKTGMRTLDTF